MLLLLSGSSSFAQLHDAHWIFGEYFAPDTINAGLMNMNFVDEPAFEGRLAGEIRYVATNASYSDKEGDLIVFSNGIEILSKDGIVLPGAENLKEG